MKVGLIEEPDLDRRHDRRHTALEQPARVGDWGSAAGSVDNS
jgi:hypothetical protein